ncbi:pLS20_p028 family conjugation system transmembrane protein [Halobacillus mangrovi]|uniref:pLS20_p028 family conjugation system transmembrane protein n=1 Tax=Halobacillus mangrovi TaxID=402384 RepID=UPI003D968ACC
MSDEELLEILLRFSEVLSTNNIFTSGLRIVGWGTVLFLKMIVDGLEGMVDQVLTLTDFFSSEPVTNFLETIQPVLYILLAISLGMIGFRLIFNKEKNRSDIPMNLFISIMTITLLSFGMGKVNDFTGDAMDVAKVQTDSFTTSDRVMEDHITDISVYDEYGWEDPEVENRHHVAPSNIDKISINETITKEFEKANGDQLTSKGKEIVMNKVGLESNGEEGLVELGKSGLFDFLPENYYRWHVDWFTAIVTLAVMAFTMILISIKVAKLCFELGFNHIVALIMAYSDISTGQRLKAIIKNIGSIFASLIMIFLSLRVYMYYTTFIDNNLEGLGYLIALIAGSLAVIDGPNIVQKLFGIDAGLKNAWHVAMGSYLASKTLGPPVKKAAGAITSGGASALMNTGAGTAGAVAGIYGRKGEGKAQTNGKSDSSSSFSSKEGNGSQGTQKKQEPSPMTSNQEGQKGSLEGKTIKSEEQNSPSSNETQGQLQPSSEKRSTLASLQHGSPGGLDVPSSKHSYEQPLSNRPMKEKRQGKIGSSEKGSERLDANDNQPKEETDQIAADAKTETADIKPPASTDDIPMPNQYRTEQRTIGEYMKDRMRERFSHNPKIQSAKRTYNLSRNTTENWINKIKKRGPES